MRAVRGYYDDAAGWYDRSRGQRYHRLVDELALDLCARHGRGRDVLEVGCGTGRLLGPIAGFARRAVGVDLSAAMLARASTAFAPKAAKGGHPVRIMFGTQVGIAPPTFVISLSHDVDLHFSYKRYLENAFRDAFKLKGTPLRVDLKQDTNPYAHKKPQEITASQERQRRRGRIRSKKMYS